MKCSHLNVVFREEHIVQSVAIIDKGEVMLCNSSHYAATGVFSMECQDCGLMRKFNRRSQNLPQWVRTALEQIALEKDRMLHSAIFRETAEIK